MVTCPRCGAENGEGAKFCKQCGTGLESKTVRCTRCGTESKYDAKYCSECGAALPAAGPVRGAVADFVAEGASNLRVIIIGAVFMLLFIGIFLLLSRSGPAGPATTTIGTTTTIAPRVLDPVVGTTYMGNVEYDRNTTLQGDIATAGNITISHGVVLYTNGHSLIAGGTFGNAGKIDTGVTGGSAALGANGQSLAGSFGGSGGSGGGGGGRSVPGSTPHAPSLTVSTIQSMYSGNMVNFLTGAGGGGGCSVNGFAGNGGNTTAQGGVYNGMNLACTGSGGVGGSGAYGIYVQAKKIAAGAIIASGQPGAAGTSDGGGGGGGGAILFAYGTGGYTPGSYSVLGGAGARDGASGGNGLVLSFSYGSSAPVNAP